MLSHGSKFNKFGPNNIAIPNLQPNLNPVELNYYQWICYLGTLSISVLYHSLRNFLIIQKIQICAENKCIDKQLFIL